MTTRSRAAEAEPSAMAQEAIAGGAVPLEGDVVPFGVAPLPSAADYGREFRVSDLIPSPAKWGEFEQREIDTIVNTDILVVDAMFFDSTLENAQPGDEWAILLCGDLASGEQFTTMTGSSIVQRKLHKLMRFPTGQDVRNVLPIVARITKTPSQVKAHSDYYDLI